MQHARMLAPRPPISVRYRTAGVRICHEDRATSPAAGSGCVFSQRHTVTRLLEMDPKRIAHVFVVMDDQDVLAAYAGILDGTGP